MKLTHWNKTLTFSKEFHLKFIHIRFSIYKLDKEASQGKFALLETRRDESSGNRIHFWKLGIFKISQAGRMGVGHLFRKHTQVKLHLDGK